MDLILSCFPSLPKFDIELKLEGGTSILNRSPLQFSGTTFDPLAEHYVSLVASLPLLDSSEEIDRQRQREFDRRVKVGEAVAQFIQAIAVRNTATREYGLYRALEQRSQLRARQGLAPVTEQVEYLEKVIQVHEKLLAARATVTQTKLALTAQCARDHQASVQTYLDGLVVETAQP